MAAPGSENPRLRAAALIIHEGKVVLVRHRAGERRYHLLPGGGVSRGETIGEALVREVLEETGLRVRPLRPLLITDSIDPTGGRHMVDMTFLAEVEGGAVTDSPQDPRVESVDLVDPETLSSLDLRPPVAEDLLAVIREGRDARARYLGARWVEER